MVTVESESIESTHLVEVMPVVNIITESTIKNSIQDISVRRVWGIIIYEKINFTVQP
jgi:hypothetical protein